MNMANIKKIQVNGSVYDVGINVYKDAGVSQQRFIELLDRDFYIPTLPSPPTADTLTYVDTDASQCRFSIGQQCRVADPNSDKGYTFYQLYAIDNLGKAVWGETGGGGITLPGNVYLTGANYYNQSVQTIKQGYLNNE